MKLNFPWLFTTVVVPIVISALLPLVDKKVKPKILDAVCAALLLYPVAILGWLILSTRLSEPIVDPIYFQSPRLGSFTMLLDPLSAPLAFSIALVTSLVSIFSLPYMRHRFEEMEGEGARPPGWGSYFMLYTMFSSAMLGTVLSTNTLEFYLFLELSLLPSFLLIAFWGYGDRTRIAIMYLIWTHVGALIFLIGSLAVGLKTGVFDILNPQTMQFNMGLGGLLSAATRLPVAIALMLGLFVKMAVFGVHIWLPYAHAEAPTPVSALLSPNLIGIAGYALIRITYTFFPAEFQQVSPYLLGLAILTMIYGGLMVLAQDDFKRLLAYSSISQMGYLLLGVSSLRELGMSGAMLHYAAHAVGKGILFMVAGTLIVQLHGLRSISKMGGLASRMPLTAGLALIGFMNITGIPPSLGLWSEILIVAGAVNRALDSGSVAFVAMIAGLLVAIGLSTAYAFVTMKRMFFGDVVERLRDAKEARLGILAPMVVIAVVGTLLFIFPQIFLQPLLDSLRALLG